LIEFRKSLIFSLFEGILLIFLLTSSSSFLTQSILSATGLQGIYASLPLFLSITHSSLVPSVSLPFSILFTAPIAPIQYCCFLLIVTLLAIFNSPCVVGFPILTQPAPNNQASVPLIYYFFTQNVVPAQYP
jgi:hypothetical protein